MSASNYYFVTYEEFITEHPESYIPIKPYYKQYKSETVYDGNIKTVKILTIYDEFEILLKKITLEIRYALYGTKHIGKKCIYSYHANKYIVNYYHDNGRDAPLFHIFLICKPNMGEIIIDLSRRQTLISLQAYSLIITLTNFIDIDRYILYGELAVLKKFCTTKNTKKHLDLLLMLDNLNHAKTWPKQQFNGQYGLQIKWYTPTWYAKKIYCKNLTKYIIDELEQLV